MRDIEILDTCEIRAPVFGGNRFGLLNRKGADCLRILRRNQLGIPITILRKAA
jgi:hypothetical protein